MPPQPVVYSVAVMLKPVLLPLWSDTNSARTWEGPSRDGKKKLENLVRHRHEIGRERGATAGPENRGVEIRSIPNGEVVCRARAGWGEAYRHLYRAGRHLATEKALAVN